MHHDDADRPEGRQDAHPPVAELVGEPFDHHGAVVGERSRRGALIFEVRDEVLCRELVEAAAPTLTGHMR